MTKYEIFKKDRVLCFRLYGQLDVETAKAYYLAVKQLIGELNDGWASLVDLNDWGLHIPEITQKMASFHEWLSKSGHEVEVCITGGSNLKAMARKKLLDESATSLKVVYVDTEEEGWQWLYEHGFVNKI